MANVDLEERLALDALGTLAEKRQLLYDSYTDLQGNLNKINTAWESTGEDKASYIKELEMLVSKMETLSGHLVALDNNVKSYLENLRATSSNTMLQ